MNGIYLGKLSEHDPLHGYLQHDIQPQISGASGNSNYRVFRLNASNNVYRYEDRNTGTNFIGKFFLSSRKKCPAKAASHLTREFDNLRMMRDYGQTGYPHHVVRPLGRNYSMNALLVTEYCEGELLSEVITEVIRSGNHGHLYHKLTALAYFLASFHNRTANGERVDFHQDCDYMDSLTEKLLQIRAIGGDEARELYWLRDQWRNQTKMWEDQKVLVHGDATPENFRFGKGLKVMTFDLEITKHADRVFELFNLCERIGPRSKCRPETLIRFKSQCRQTGEFMSRHQHAARIRHGVKQHNKDICAFGFVCLFESSRGRRIERLSIP